MKSRSLSSRISQRVWLPFEWFIAFTLTLFVILRLPSLFEPYWYGDEGIYETIGMALRHGRLLYQGIWDNKPPLLYLIYAIFNGDQFWVRLLSLVVGALTVFVFYHLCKKLFNSSTAIYGCTLFFAIAFGLPLLEGNIANAENFILLPIITVWLGVYTHFPKNKSKIHYLLFGILMSLAALTKVVAIFDLAAMGLFMFLLFVDKRSKNPFAFVQEWIVFAVGFIIPILVTVLYFLSIHAFRAFAAATFSQNIKYVGVNNYFLFPMGLVIMKVVGLLAGVVVLGICRKRLSKEQLMIGMWFIFALFGAFFSERPYTHYLLMLLPSFTLLIGLLFERGKFRLMSAAIIAITIVLISLNFIIYTRDFGYYKNFVSYIFGSMPADQYEAFFDPNTPLDYTLADFVRTHTSFSDAVFFWSDSGQLYALSDKLPPGRYIVAYHISFYPDGYTNTENAIARTKPKYIISTRDDIPALILKNYTLKYHYKDSRIYERKL